MEENLDIFTYIKRGRESTGRSKAPSANRNIAENTIVKFMHIKCLLIEQNKHHHHQYVTSHDPTGSLKMYYSECIASSKLQVSTRIDI
ncbi:hypothetical protein MANES_05G109400v8 [Manihot esculenta]|uniref:Uncharacterized protein n=1 Tax=Manihot esculenta TaxID=3983 RepID=A0A2C9VV86_MANES|nr:hypothetical protein MANES_05G109400v8 [Manihot esculenta]